MKKDPLMDEKMILSPYRRKPGKVLVSGTISAGVHYGFRNFTRPHLGFRLGLLWVFLDPLLRAMVFAFLMIVIRGSTSPESLVIGVFTLTSLNTPFSKSMNIRLSEEPFPLSHTPTITVIISKVISDVLTAVFLGFSAASILIIVSEPPLFLVVALPLACCSLTLIGSGVGLILSPFIMAIKDLSKLIGYILLLSFFLQCVIYPYSLTEGYHRMVLYWLPHTIAVEWCRSVASGTSFPFTLEHSLVVFFLWSLPMMYGFLRFDHNRWRSTTWS